MAVRIEQNTSSNVVIGPLINASGSVMINLNIDNDAIGLYKPPAFTSVARNATTSAASVGPGLYRIVLNATDTNTLGETALMVSGSGALLFRKDMDIWQSPTFALYYGSADEIATSADVAGLSATVAGVSAAVAAVSAAVANVSARVEVVRVEQSADQALLSAQIAGLSATVAGVSGAVAGVSAALSTHAAQALSDLGLHVLVIGSASAQPTNNSLIGRIMTSASADTYDRTTDSLAAQADQAAAGGVTSAAVSTIISAVVQNVVDLNQIPSSAEVSTIVQNIAISSASLSTQMAQAVSDGLEAIGLHVLVIGSASANQPTNNSLLGRIMTSASADTYDRTTDSLAAQADVAAAGGVTSAAVSVIISAVVLQALQDQGLHVLVNGSASSQPTNNSLLGRIMTSASADTYDRTTDSLAAQADVAAAGGVTSAAVSVIISAVVQNVVGLNQIPSSAAVSGIVGGALTNYGTPTSAAMSAMVSAVLNSYGVASAGDVQNVSAAVAAVSAAVANVSARVETVRVEQSADQALLSAQIAGVSAAVAGVSAAVANVSSRVETVRVEQSADQALLSAQIAGVSVAVAAVSAAVANVSSRVETVRIEQSADQALLSAQIAGVSAAIPTSAEISGIVEQAVWQRTLTEASGVPLWSDVQADDALEWIFQRNVARTHQASTSVAIYSSAGNQIASASANITSTSANIDRWTS